MCRTKGAKNYFDTKKLYYISDCIGYCEREGVKVPESWRKNTLLRRAREWGFEPDYDNGIDGIGHKVKFGGRKMTTFSQRLVRVIRTERKVKNEDNTLPLEQMAKEAAKAEKKPKPVEPIAEPDINLDSLFGYLIEIQNAANKMVEAIDKALGR